MKKVLIIGAGGGLAQYVIAALRPNENIHLTLLARNSHTIGVDTTGCDIVEADVMDYDKLKEAVKGQDIVYINLAGNLESLSMNIVKAMIEMSVRRVIAISSIGIYKSPVPSILIPYRKLANVIEDSGLDYTILRPDWFTNGNEIDYAITQKNEPENGSAVSRKSIAAFISLIIENPALHKNENVGISKPL